MLYEVQIKVMHIAQGSTGRVHSRLEPLPADECVRVPRRFCVYYNMRSLDADNIDNKVRFFGIYVQRLLNDVELEDLMVLKKRKIIPVVDPA